MNPRRRIPAAEHLALIRRAIGVVWAGGRSWTIASMALLVIQGALPVVSLYLLKLVIDAVASSMAAPPPRPWEPIVAPVIALLAVYALTALCRSVGSWVSEGQSLAVTDHVQRMLQEKSVAVDLAYYETPQYYDTLHRAQQEGAYRPTMIARGLVSLLQNSISLAGTIGLIVAFDARVAAMIIVMALPGLFIRLGFSHRLYNLRRSQTGTFRKGDYLHWVLTSDEHAREVRVFELGGELIRRFGELRLRLRGERLSLAARLALSDFATQLLAIGALFAAFGYAIHLTLAGVLTIGAMVMYYQALQRGQAFLADTLRATAELYEGNLYLANFYEFLGLEQRVVDGPSPRAVPAQWSRGIELRNVSFRYPEGDRLVIEDVSFGIAPGEVVALVGENGSGKTTLIKLLCRLYDPSSGEVRLEGEPLAGYALEQVRRSISVVFQDYAQYELTARENIWFGDLRADKGGERLREVARLSGADAVIAELPQGYDTTLGNWFEGGHELSVGQWQKVAVARGLFRQAQLVVLDEPTASMDARAEAAFFEGFRGALEGRGALLISHRFSTVRMADRIVVLEGGKVMEQGTHDELVERGGTYAKLYALQARSYR